jgi:hypothetical protein
MYDPPPSSVDEYLTMAATIGIDHGIAVVDSKGCGRWIEAASGASGSMPCAKAQNCSIDFAGLRFGEID